MKQKTVPAQPSNSREIKDWSPTGNTAVAMCMWAPAIRGKGSTRPEAHPDVRSGMLNYTSRKGERSVEL